MTKSICKQALFSAVAAVSFLSPFRVRAVDIPRAEMQRVEPGLREQLQLVLALSEVSQGRKTVAAGLRVVEQLRVLFSRQRGSRAYLQTYSYLMDVQLELAVEIARPRRGADPDKLWRLSAEIYTKLLGPVGTSAEFLRPRVSGADSDEEWKAFEDQTRRRLSAPVMDPFVRAAALYATRFFMEPPTQDLLQTVAQYLRDGDSTNVVQIAAKETLQSLDTAFARRALAELRRSPPSQSEGSKNLTQIRRLVASTDFVGRNGRKLHPDAQMMLRRQLLLLLTSENPVDAMQGGYDFYLKAGELGFSTDQRGLLCAIADSFQADSEAGRSTDLLETELKVLALIATGISRPKDKREALDFELLMAHVRNCLEKVVHQHDRIRSGVAMVLEKFAHAKRKKKCAETVLDPNILGKLFPH